MKTLLHHRHAMTKPAPEIAQTSWLRNPGVAGVAFFFAKGMIWLVLGWLGWVGWLPIE